MSIRKYIEHHIQLHTLRIELMNGKVLLYRIDAVRKEELEEMMNYQSDDLMESLGHKKTPVPNRGFVPGLPKPYSFFGPDTQIYGF